jgi:myo-inositol-1(or 4)-monophosphatase
MAVRSATINVMTAAALKAARGLIREFGEVEQLQVSVKGPGDFVTTADLRAERLLRTELAKARPGYAMLMEEGGAEAGSDPRHRWIVGVIYEPLRDEMFWAEKGAGAFLNDRRLRVSGRRRLGEAVIGTGIPFAERGDHARYLETLSAVMGATSGVRRMGAAALDLAYVAAGRLDGFWEFGLSPWDIAAGILLIRESGGYVTDLAGGHRMMETGDVLAANDHLHLPLAQLLKKSFGQPAAR